MMWTHYGEIGRLLVSVSSDGRPIENSFYPVVRSHRIALIPFSIREDSDFMQAEIKATHRVLPESPHIVNNAKPGDFYIIENSLYRIRNIKKYGDFIHFVVYEDAAGKIDQAEIRVGAAYQFDVSAGSYSWGSSPFSNIVAKNTPFVVFVPTVDGEAYISQLDTSGFTITDRGIGQPFKGDVIVWNGEYQAFDRWYITNLSAGVYVFGSGALLQVPKQTRPPFVMAIPIDDASCYVDQISQYGFRIVDRGIGEPAKCNVLILQDTTLIPNRHIVHNLSPGTYQFGQGVLSSIKGMYTRPVVLKQDNSDGQTYLANITDKGFTIVDRGIGGTPVCSIAIIQL